MSKTIKCKKVNLDMSSQEITYYSLSNRYVSTLECDDFVYIVDRHVDGLELNIYEVCKIYGSNNNLKDIEIMFMKETEEIHLVSDEHFLDIKEQVVDECSNSRFEVISKHIKELIKEVDWRMSGANLVKIDECRMRYLEKIFHTDELKELKSESERMTKSWFYKMNRFELGLIHIINLYKTYSILTDIINKSRKIKEHDKLKLNNLLVEECYVREYSIQLKGNNRFIEDRPIGISFSDDSQNITFGKLTRYEISINFFSIWNTTNRMLTVSFIPVVMLLLDNSKKMQIYLLLGLVYFITLILSDERQISNIVAFMKQLDEKSSINRNYYKLFFFGAISVIVFVIISMQITFMPAIVESYLVFGKYLIADLLVSVLAFVLIISFIETGIYIMSCLTSTVFYLKRKAKMIAFTNFIIRTVFGIVSVISLYDILGLEVYDETIDQFPWRYILFGLSVIIALSIVIDGYIKLKETKNSVNSLFNSNN